MNPDQIESAAKEIASRLLTPGGHSECHRLQIMERIGPRLSDERDMGGHCKSSIIGIVRDVLNERAR